MLRTFGCIYVIVNARSRHNYFHGRFFDNVEWFRLALNHVLALGISLVEKLVTIH